MFKKDSGIFFTAENKKTAHGKRGGKPMHCFEAVGSFMQ
jgi:hypothetical protein